MLTKEQMNALPGMVARLGGHDGFAAWDASDSLRDMAPSLAATVIEQQAAIERLREALDIYAPNPSFIIEEHDQ